MNMKQNIILSLQGVSYLYGELPAGEQEAFHNQRIIHTWLYDEIEECREMAREITKAKVSPSITTLKNILAYSKKVY